MLSTTLQRVCAIGCLLASSAANALLLSLDPAVQVVDEGAGVAVDLNISGLGLGSAPSLASYDVFLGYDDSILLPEIVFFGDPVLGNQLDLDGFGTTFGAFDFVGTLNIFEFSFDLPGTLDALQADSFTLATVVFSTIDSGLSDLTIEFADLGDALGDPLTDVEVANAVVEVAPVPVPATLLFLGAGLLGFSFSRRRLAVASV